MRATCVAAAIAICFGNQPAGAQTTARPSGTSVAVIDLGDVFDAHPRLKSQLEQLKSQIEAFEAFVRQERQKVETLAEQLKTLKPGTPDYTSREKEFASIQADLQVQVRQKSREFLEQEAAVRFEAYQDIQQHVARFCQNYGIQLVIRYNRAAIDPTKPQDVQMGLNRPIVYQNSLDITQHIIDALSAVAAAPAAAAQPSVGARPPQIPRGTQQR
jgi:Skp family chaperone for outer membrane proteins